MLNHLSTFAAALREIRALPSCRNCRHHRYVAKLDQLHCEHGPAKPWGRGVIYVDVLEASAQPINAAALESRCETVAAGCRNYQQEA